jgi:hypothetical protein
MNPTASGDAIDVLELRQYTVRSAMRDRLPSLFREHFVAAQEAAGARILGTFADLGDPDRFVWLRGYREITARGPALQAFYGSEVWKRHRDAANAAIVDSDNALLLRALPGGAFSGASLGGVLRVSIRYLGTVDALAFARWFDEAIVPLVGKCGGSIAARYVTEHEPNDFPALPVREESTLVWFGRFADAAAEREFSGKLAAARGWRDDVPVDLLPALMRKPEVLRLGADGCGTA